MRRFVLSAMLLFLAVPAAGQQLVFVVRHAERADTVSGGAPTMAADPDLSDAGRARAQSLATMLKDAKIKAIFVTEFKRTQQTAEPLAKALGLTPTAVAARSLSDLVAKIREVEGNVLVVGHSNTVPDVIDGLGAHDRQKIADDEYDNLFVVTIGQQRSVVRLHYR